MFREKPLLDRKTPSRCVEQATWAVDVVPLLLINGDWAECCTIFDVSDERYVASDVAPTFDRGHVLALVDDAIYDNGLFRPQSLILHAPDWRSDYMREWAQARHLEIVNDPHVSQLMWHPSALYHGTFRSVEAAKRTIYRAGQRFNGGSKRSGQNRDGWSVDLHRLLSNQSRGGKLPPPRPD